ncbi:hypothetical protein H0H81_003564 [Sphagnurus paluster]|uniref:FAD-binding domain-containing protein n=1 Tax=Sphagnurus paluster TaxID=117069 RepID=A0A9P7K3N5_9AGAR|nr:hypothetical protein H0H81_003564 [Sphagnurus paluster]
MSKFMKLQQSWLQSVQGSEWLLVLKRLGLADELLKYTEVREGGVNTIRSFHRPDFQQALVGRLPASCRIHCSKRLQSYCQQPTGQIEIQFEDGSTTTCDVLIGADGIKSAVRRTFAHEKVTLARSQGKSTGAAEHEAFADPVWSGMVAYRALIPLEKLRLVAPDHPTLLTSAPCCYVGKNKFIIVYPMSRGKFVNFVAYDSQPELEGTTFNGPWVSTVSPTELAGLFSTWETDIQTLISCVENPLLWAVHTVNTLESFISGRVALVGDAAHAMTPFQGSGAGQAIEDAFILATLLGHHATTLQTLDHALLVYDKVRRPRAVEVVANSRESGRLLMLHDYDFRGMSDDAVLKELHTIGEKHDRSADWTWNTSIDESVEEALTMLLENAVL